MNTETITENLETTESKMQFILDENGELQEISKDKCRPVEYPIKYKLKNAFEVFVRVDGTENYWISNYGRCVNNLNHKDKNRFYKHKEGKCHYTIFEIEREIQSRSKKKRKSRGKTKTKSVKDVRTHKYFSADKPIEECNFFLQELQEADEKRTYFIQEYKQRRETSPDMLVAESFLVYYSNRNKVWHKDGDESNNWYKNLITVTPQDYMNLKAGKVTWQELNLEQEYIEYENKASLHAYRVYDGILARCRSTKATDSIHKCYSKSSMCDVWMKDPKTFVKWYLEHYYECGDEQMDVDKDLFGDGSGMYHPDFCCILPKGINTLLANAKKHYRDNETTDNVLPLGVSYNGKTGKYTSSIQFTGTEKAIPLSEWDTAEEAFEEYRVLKKADILIVAAKYKENIPDDIYNRLLKVEIKPY
ncbi:MAG: hypothetical protein HFG92_03280 [Dorea sp.]|jgi:hypothetical protein|nr:hypothetical protein [Dorea sp.]